MARRTTKKGADRLERRDLLERLHVAGRAWSNAAVMFHTAVGERLGLGATDMKTLDLLDRHGPLSAGELVRLSGLAAPSISGVIDRLEAKGAVRRRRDPEDGRRVIVELAREALGSPEAVFGGLLARMTRLYERYSDAELELLLDFVVEATREQQAATAALAETQRGKKR